MNETQKADQTPQLLSVAHNTLTLNTCIHFDVSLVPCQEEPEPRAVIAEISPLDVLVRFVVGDCPFAVCAPPFAPRSSPALGLAGGLRLLYQNQHLNQADSEFEPLAGAFCYDQVTHLLVALVGARHPANTLDPVSEINKQLK